MSKEPQKKGVEEEEEEEEESTPPVQAPVQATTTKKKAEELKEKKPLLIKRIVLLGFKSYRDQQITFVDWRRDDPDDFNTFTNVLVGRNGTGKSNLIVAIRYLLSSDFLKLRTEERKALLFKGAGENIVSGSVEITFDNLARRFPIDSNEVRLKRNIGLTKAEYYLNDKHISAEDVMNLLESAGFSRSNPYYIVQQGKVQALTKMKPSERLELLYEVAGTRVYDERKYESQRIMAESATKKEAINEVLMFLKERLNELEGEKAELEAYRELDRTKRALEYTIGQREIDEIRKKQESFQDVHDIDLQKLSKLSKKIPNIMNQIKDLEKEIKSANSELEKFNKEKQFCQDELADLDKKRARLELILANYSSNKTDVSKKRERALNEKDELKLDIAKAKEELEKVRPEFEKAQENEQVIKERIMSHERRLQELSAKQGWGTRFSSDTERDRWINKEITSIQNSLKNQNEQLEKLRAEIEKIDQTIKTENDNLNNKDTNFDLHKSTRDGLNEDYAKLKDNMDKLFNRRKEKWKEDNDIDHELTQQKQALEKAERQLYSTMPLEQAKGLEAIKRYKRDQKITGIHAPLIELFTCNNEVITAVEVAAKGALFYVVVDTDETAKKLLNMLNTEKAGRVTFMPLNKLTVQNPPTYKTEFNFPINDLLKYDDMYRSAFLQVFAKTYFCHKEGDATAISKQYNVDCVTTDGSKVNRKGAISGGFYDTRQSRINLMFSITKMKTTIAELEDKSKKVKKAVSDLDSTIDGVVKRLQQIENKRTEARDTFETFQRDTASAQKKLLSLETQKQEKTQRLKELEISIRQLAESKQSIESELGKKFRTKLTEDEQTELSNLNTELSALRREENTLRTIRTDFEAKKTTQELKLANNLYPRLEEIEKELATFVLSEEDINFDRVRAELNQITEKINQTNAKYQKINDEIKKTTKDIENLKKRIDDLKDKESKNNQILHRETKNVEKNLNNRDLLNNRLEEIRKKQRDIGSLPSIPKEISVASMPELVQLLKETKQKLKGLNPVNQKALDQYLQFSEQREVLLAKKQDLDESEEAIKALIKTLDDKKNEAIELTLKIVATFFAQVFKKLTGEGRAELVMHKKPEEGEKSDEEGKVDTTSIKKYKGVDIKVSFTSSGKQQRMNQLSGGQQSLVALALIFAIQKCDPAPFYIFDEVDAALDDTYRLSVAKMIKEQSDKEKIQFILTTHRPELVNHSHKQYLIAMKNQVSTIKECDKEEALDLLRAAHQEELLAAQIQKSKTTEATHTTVGASTMIEELME